MGNPNKGEVTFEHDGKLYTVALDFYALAVLQRQTKEPTGQFLVRSNGGWGYDDILQVCYAMLFRRYRMTEEQIADMIDGMGIDRVLGVIKEAIAAATARQQEVLGTASPPPTAEMTSTE